MYSVVVVIWKSLHVIIDNPVYNKNGKTDDEFSGSRSKVIKRIENSNQYELICFKAD
ncbi:hypothetical protein D3C85_1144170 [compost metagenome]